MKYNKNKVSIYKMDTEVGKVLVLGNFQKVNRPTKVYLAEKIENLDGKEYLSSVFYLVRPKDVNKLEKIGYTIYSIVVPKGFYAVASIYGSKLKVLR